MAKHGDKKRFMEFVKCVKQNPHRYFYIKSTLIKLKEADVDINTQVYGGATLLHVALKLNNLKLFKLFIKSGVNVNLANESGETPLHRAVLENKMNFIKSLFNNEKCDLNMGAELEQTPLHLAVINGNLDIVKTLVDNGAEIMVLDEINNLPIDYAIDEKDINIIKYFLSKQDVNDTRLQKINKILEEAGEANV